MGVVDPARPSQGCGDARGSVKGPERGVGMAKGVMLVVAEESGVRDLGDSSVLADRDCVPSVGVLPDRRRESEICFESLGAGLCRDGITRGASCLNENVCSGAEVPSCWPSASGLKRKCLSSWFCLKLVPGALMDRS